MKYLIVRDPAEEEYAIVFPDSVIHKDVARIHRATGVRVVSAGFCNIGQTCSAWGKSESLRMESRSQDAAILQRDFGAFNQQDEDKRIAFVTAAQLRTSEGVLEVDDHAILSGSGDDGDYVAAWLWVSNEEAEWEEPCED